MSSSKKVEVGVESLFRTSTGVRTVGAILTAGRACRPASRHTLRDHCIGALANGNSNESSKARKDQSYSKLQHGTARLFRILEMIRVCNPTSTLRQQEHNIKLHIASKKYLQISLLHIPEPRQLRNIQRYKGT